FGFQPGVKLRPAGRIGEWARISDGGVYCRMATPKLSAKQQSQLAFLQLLPPRLQRLNSTVEQMSGGKVDESLVRGMIRVLYESKDCAFKLGMLGLADSSSQMWSTARRGGGAKVRVWGLEITRAYSRTPLDMATNKASLPEADAPPEDSPRQAQ